MIKNFQKKEVVLKNKSYRPINFAVLVFWKEGMAVIEFIHVFVCGIVIIN